MECTSVSVEGKPLLPLVLALTLGVSVTCSRFSPDHSPFTPPRNLSSGPCQPSHKTHELLDCAPHSKLRPSPHLSGSSSVIPKSFFSSNQFHHGCFPCTPREPHPHSHPGLNATCVFSALGALYSFLLPGWHPASYLLPKTSGSATTS